MSKARLLRIDVAGFRSFGQSSQGFDVPPAVAVLWGANSQGKTSLAEALEFLFSGQIVRRDLLASAKDEFAEALRCAHVGTSCPTYVEAKIAAVDGTVRTVRRTLIEDYKRGSAAGCVSDLKIDGAKVQESAIQRVLGIPLSHPPLVAPVLTQHTLAYIFSVSPTERANYFRALLDTQDLEDFRAAVSKLGDAVPAPTHPYMAKLTELEKIPVSQNYLAVLRKATSVDEVVQHLTSFLGALLTSIGIAPLRSLNDDTVLLAAELETRRGQTFPIELFRRGSPTQVANLSENEAESLGNFLKEREKVAAETEHLISLFSAALALHTHGTDDAEDCPLCGTKEALTPARRAYLASELQSAAAYREAAAHFGKTISSIEAQATAALSTYRQALPDFMRRSALGRRSAGFSVAKIKSLVNDDELVENWLRELRGIIRGAIRLGAAYRAILSQCRLATDDPGNWNGQASLNDTISDAVAQQERGAGLAAGYLESVRAVYEPLKDAVDLNAATDGWDALVDCSNNPSATFAASTVVSRHAALLKTIQAAHDEIDKGNGKVADGKFADLSDDVKLWWERLRPDEPTFFDGVKRRSVRARRTVDLRVGMAANDDRSDAKFRDAIAVLSQSQLHCLGLSLFLARAVKENVGFVVLDDPVLTSDDDYRPNFASSVIEGLIRLGIQVIVVTQDYSTWKDIGHRWGHVSVSQLQLVRNNPVEGTEIRNLNDDLATMIARAQPFVKSQDPEQRKKGAAQIRDAIERFSKSLLVKDRKARGDNLASITDYDGKNFGNYSGEVRLLLTADGSHPGKLTQAHSYVTPGAHDDTPPSAGQLSMALGDLRRLKKDYLDN